MMRGTYTGTSNTPIRSRLGWNERAIKTIRHLDINRIFAISTQARSKNGSKGEKTAKLNTEKLEMYCTSWYF